jgi:hypothetical protein
MQGGGVGGCRRYPIIKTPVEMITSCNVAGGGLGLRSAATMEPGAVASEVARSAGVHVSQLFR